MAADATMTGQEIRRLLAQLRDVFTYIGELRRADAIAAEIQFPTVPPRLSESLAVEMIRNGAILSHLRGAELTQQLRDDNRVALGGAIE
jgi:hypothetical protein